MAELTCPKCQSPMRGCERSGITVDQCTGCGGLFLDRGELERLMQAEDTHYGGYGGLAASIRRDAAADSSRDSSADTVGAAATTEAPSPQCVGLRPEGDSFDGDDGRA